MYKFVYDINSIDDWVKLRTELENLELLNSFHVTSFNLSKVEGVINFSGNSQRVETTPGRMILGSILPKNKNINFQMIEVLNKDSSIREFLIKTDKNVDEVIDGMAEKGFLAGIKYDNNQLLIAVTEKRTKEEIDRYVNSLKKVINE